MSARIHACARTRLARIRRNEAGQSTAEYALVILGAVAIATLLITWATGSHAISQLFDSVIQKILPS
jgi:Flp pilus assembly pilin Flp